MASPVNHEEALVKAFIRSSRQERYLSFISNPRRRGKLGAEFAHFKALDARRMVDIPRNQQHPDGILKLLRSKGAGPRCWVISENSELDGREMELQAALQETIGRQMGTLISCVPGRLGYFEDEDGRCILERAG